MNFKNVLRLMFIVLTTTFISCDSDDDSPVFMGDEKVYTLNSVADPNISGTATFRMNPDNSTTIDIELMNTSNLIDMMPAHIHFNSAAEGGGIAVSLNAVDPATGMSSTQVNALNDGTSITYSELLNFDGYINVHESMNNLGTLYGQGDIGQNELTGEMKSYALGSVTDPNISGEVIFMERQNGNALAQLNLNGPTSGIIFESHIHMNSAAEGGGIAFFFTDIDGDAGSSVTHVEALEDGTAFGYDDVLNYDGYVNVHLKSDLSVLYAQGDMGVNELTGNTIFYDLNAVSGSMVSGTALFSERISGDALLEISLTGTQAGNSHPSHIHDGSVSNPGGIAVGLTPVNGATGRSVTNISMTESGNPFGYSDVDSFEGYINVHLSADDLATLVAQGNIGSSL